MEAKINEPDYWSVWTEPASTALSETRCRELLGTHSVGRVAWQAADGLQMLPISYVCYQHGVAFRTSPYGMLSDLVRPTEVVFEADQLDPGSRTGWSVVLRGRAEAVAEPRDLVELWRVDGLVPWASGVRNLFIQVTPRQLSGRAFSGSARPLGS